ncbi:hypothetical protein CEXT_205511 [Caerostris extrusa]|uniref:Uncharacterized protein n=1 Tax=Caerostris extrusa TaxID=172846 RepID=A0AAV4UZS5_CAEEX|nr:hypothetical protein CEXT_205511 [Caerostris extrusa]
MRVLPGRTITQRKDISLQSVRRKYPHLVEWRLGKEEGRFDRTENWVRFSMESMRFLRACLWWQKVVEAISLRSKKKANK